MNSKEKKQYNKNENKIVIGHVYNGNNNNNKNNKVIIF